MARRAARPKRLDRLISRAGLGSRTQAREWIAAGRVAAYRRVVRDPDRWVDPHSDHVTLEGRPLRPPRRIYLALNKPEGFVTTRTDLAGRPTVCDLIRDLPRWVSPAGRLDRESGDLLILTNDTAFAHHITSPDGKVAKTYRVETTARLSDEQLGHLEGGVWLPDGPARALRVARIANTERRTVFEKTLSEGRNRQVRRMVRAVGAGVRRLTRRAVGSLRLEGLDLGRWRRLTAAEVPTLWGRGQPAGRRPLP